MEDYKELEEIFEAQANENLHQLAEIFAKQFQDESMKEKTEQIAWTLK